MYIYADILIITNIYIDYLLIYAVKALTHTPMKSIRGIAAACIGSLFSLMIFLPSLPDGMLTLSKLFSAALIILIAFGYGNIHSYIKRYFIFCLVSFIFSGLATAAAYMSGGKTITGHNGVIYADFSATALVLTSIAAYATIAVYRRIATGGDSAASYTVIISDKGKTIGFHALADSGNILHDSFTGRSVIICPAEYVSELYGNIPDEKAFIDGNAAAGWRMIPFSTISSNGMIAIIRPKELCIKNNDTGKVFRADVYIAAAPSETQAAVFNPKILI